MDLKRPAFDTSVLIAALQSWHPEHERSLRALDDALNRPPVIVPLHALLETYSVLTRLPRRLHLSPERACDLLNRTFQSDARFPELGEGRAFELLRSFQEPQITGGAVYDALIAESARRAGADGIVTLNRKHFERVAPEGLEVVEP